MDDRTKSPHFSLVREHFMDSVVQIARAVCQSFHCAFFLPEGLTRKRRAEPTERERNGVEAGVAGDAGVGGGSSEQRRVGEPGTSGLGTVSTASAGSAGVAASCGGARGGGAGDGIGGGERRRSTKANLGSVSPALAGLHETHSHSLPSKQSPAQLPLTPEYTPHFVPPLSSVIGVVLLCLSVIIPHSSGEAMKRI